MSKRGPVTFAKRQREKEKKQAADSKRSRRAERALRGPSEPEIQICKPILDEEQP